MDNFLKVENDESLVRDLSNNALLNVDKTALERSRRQRKSMQNQLERIDRLEKSLDEIKSMLTQIIQK